MKRRRWKQTTLGLAAGLIAVVAVSGLTSATAAVSSGSTASFASGSRRDRVATLAYLRAELAYAKAAIAAAPASAESLHALAATLGGECHGVFDLAPKPEVAGDAPRSARQSGEKNRLSRQRSDLADELTSTIQVARNRPYRQAVLSFARKIEALSWSDAAVTEYEHADAASLLREAQGVTPAVCADMKVWVLSGYRTLAPATKVLARERIAAYRPFRRLFEGSGVGAFTNPLSRYEEAQAKALGRRIAGVLQRGERALQPVFAAALQIRLALGVTSEAELKELAKSSGEHQLPPKGATVIGKGKTAAGSSYTVWVEPRKRRAGSKGSSTAGGLLQVPTTRAGCRVNVDILESSPESSGDSLVISGGTIVVCLSRTPAKGTRVGCEGEVRTIQAQTLASARDVRLTLRDGDQIVSRVALVPRRLGDLAGLYYQAVPVWASAPVSLTELDGRGRPLRTVRLSRTPGCVTQWPFVRPGSVRTIAGGRLPGGSGFSIVGRSERRGEGPSAANALSLQVEVGGELGVGGIQREAGGPFAWQIDTGCEPREYAIVYGTLKNPRDTVWARGPSGLVRLRRTRLPASLHEPGVLVYKGLPVVPSELIVRAPDGTSVLARKLTHIAREARETCEGEAEPA